MERSSGNLDRESNQEDPLPSLASRTIRNKLGTIKSNRALSLDHHSCGDLKELPLEAYEDLATTFNQISKEGEWPMNGTMVRVALIPKDDGGDRPIGITPLLAALFLKSHGEFVTEWEE